MREKFLTHHASRQHIQNGEDFFVFGNIGHVVAVMDKTGHAGLVYNDLGGHPSQFEEAHFLAVQFEDGMIGVWQADVRQFFFLPVIAEGVSIFRANNDNFSMSVGKFIVITAQLRHVPAAVRSGKTAIKDEYDVLFTAKIR